MARSAKKTTRKTTDKPRGKNKEVQLEKQRRNRESKGVICIAFGVLLGVYLFVDATGTLGDLLSHILFGLFGWAAYVVPVIMIAAGVMIIHGSRVNDFGEADWMFIFVGVDIISLFHLARNQAYRGVSFGSYISEAYRLGSDYRLGGGAVGSFLSYPLRQFGGNVLAYIFLITFLIITLIMVTRISLKKVGAGIGRRVSTAYRSAHESVSQAWENRPERERKPHKLFVVETVDEEEPEEEFDNPFLPESKQRASADLEGFDATVGGIPEYDPFPGITDFVVPKDDAPSQKEKETPAEPAVLPDAAEPQREETVSSHAARSPFNPDMGTVSSLRKLDEEHNVKHISASVERPSAVNVGTAIKKRAASAVTTLENEEDWGAPLKRSRVNIVPAPQEDPDDIWGDTDENEDDAYAPEADAQAYGTEEDDASGPMSFDVPEFLPRVPGNPVYAPAPMSLKRPGVQKEQPAFTSTFDGVLGSGSASVRNDPVQPPRSAKRGTFAAQEQEPAPAAAKDPFEEKKQTATAPKAAGSAAAAAVPAVVPAAKAPGEYSAPPFDLLDPVPAAPSGSDDPETASETLVKTLQDFGISVKMIGYSVGPVITRFELQPAPGVRVSRITGLSNDIALALAAERVRIEAPIPGKSAVGIEVPNKHSVSVVLREIVESREFSKATSPITLAFGKDIAGKVVTANLEKMPHLLIAGATGSGKSVCINDLILSMVFKSSPDNVRMILIDPKVVELKVYSELPHLLIPVVTDAKKAAGALRWAVNEMMNRYKKFSERGVRNIQGFNEVATADEHYARLVVIIDELADLMMVAPDDVEDSICRIAQLGRAAGIHLIVATQRPSADIITGLIKANIPSRCAFAVSSGIDSRIILDEMGAEKLLGRGDMLFHPNGAGKPMRCQCAFVSDDEVERIMNWFKQGSTGAPNYDEKFVDEVMNAATGGAVGGVFGEGKQEDELFLEALGVVVENGAASISMIQRRLRVGYARAARLIDMMEQKGYVSGFDGAKPRRLLITKSAYQRLLAGEEGAPEPEEETDEAPFDTDGE